MSQDLPWHNYEGRHRPARRDPAGGDGGWMAREAERGGWAALVWAAWAVAGAAAQAVPLLWLRLTPHRMSHRRVALSTAISSLSVWRPMGSRLSLTDPCATNAPLRPQDLVHEVLKLHADRRVSAVPAAPTDLQQLPDTELSMEADVAWNSKRTASTATGWLMEAWLSIRGLGTCLDREK